MGWKAVVHALVLLSTLRVACGQLHANGTKRSRRLNGPPPGKSTYDPRLAALRAGRAGGVSSSSRAATTPGVKRPSSRDRALAQEIAIASTPRAATHQTPEDRLWAPGRPSQGLQQQQLGRTPPTPPATTPVIKPAPTPAPNPGRSPRRRRTPAETRAEARAEARPEAQQESCGETGERDAGRGQLARARASAVASDCQGANGSASASACPSPDGSVGAEHRAESWT